MKIRYKELNELLADFWWHASQDARKETRIGLLKSFAKRQVFVGFNDPTIAEVRDEWIRMVRRKENERQPTCFCCHKKRKTETHHIILLKHGGSNHLRNRVSICRQCHSLIHPWLR